MPPGTRFYRGRWFIISLYTFSSTQFMDDTGYTLTPEEIRVLGVLIEKSFVSPDTYPLSINALTNGCNQLTARDPVMTLSEQEVQEAVDRLVALKLVSRRDQPSGRVAKYEHQLRLRHSLSPSGQAVLAILLLRGPQTAGEIRQRSERLHRFDDIAQVETVLEYLGEKNPSMVVDLPRPPGTKEPRYMHLLGGHEMAEAAQSGHAAAAATRGGKLAELEAEVGRLREELDALKSDFQTFRQQFE